MLGKSVITFSPLEEGILLKRYKRFLADIELKSGEVITAHCANTGPMKGVLKIGGLVRLRYAPSPKRKLQWTWEQVQVVDSDGNSQWVGINTSFANKIILNTIRSGFLSKELGEELEIKQEVAYGKDNRSRIDFLLRSKNNTERDTYLEVKNTTLTNGRVALFPDTVTLRGQKHLKELTLLLPKSRSILLPCITRNDVDSFAPGESEDPMYGKLFHEAVKAGVEVIPCCFGFYSNKITWEGKRPLKQSKII